MRYLLLFAIVIAAGCADYQPASTPAAPKAQSAPPAPTAQPSGPGAASASAPAPQFPIQLSTGAALAQTGTEGTMMSFSVDYQFNEGQQPQPSQRYVWVIERTTGAAAKIPVQLRASGNLIAPPLTSWRPEEGPFQGHVEDASGNRLSETIPLK